MTTDKCRAATIRGATGIANNAIDWLPVILIKESEKNSAAPRQVSLLDQAGRRRDQADGVFVIEQTTDTAMPTPDHLRLPHAQLAPDCCRGIAGDYDAPPRRQRRRHRRAGLSVRREMVLRCGPRS